MLNIVCWKWKGRTSLRVAEFTADHVNALAEMLRRTTSLSYRLICITDDPMGIECETYPLWQDHADLPNPCGDDFPRCYRRLKLFSANTTRAMGIDEGAPVLSVDLDVVIVHDLVPLVMKHWESNFVGWRTTIGTYKPVYNGSLFYFRAGRMAHIWDRFDPVTSPLLAKAHCYFGSDQGWTSYVLAESYPRWLKSDGVYSFEANLCRVRGLGGALPADARIICFNGPHKPWDEDVRRSWPWIAALWPGHKTVVERLAVV